MFSRPAAFLQHPFECFSSWTRGLQAKAKDGDVTPGSGCLCDLGNHWDVRRPDNWQLLHTLVKQRSLSLWESGDGTLLCCISNFLHIIKQLQFQFMTDNRATWKEPEQFFSKIIKKTSTRVSAEQTRVNNNQRKQKHKRMKWSLFNWI